MKIKKYSPEWRELPFAKRAGKVKVELADVRKLPKEFKERVWKIIQTSLSGARSRDNGGFHKTQTGAFWEKFLGEHIEDIVIRKYLGCFSRGSFLSNGFRHAVLDDAPWPVITALECMFRTPGMPKNLEESIQRELENSPYHLDTSTQPVCIEASLQHANKVAVQRSVHSFAKYRHD